MQPFMYDNPTRLLFGNGQLDQLGKQLKKVGKNILLVYGSGSIIRTGVYDAVIQVLQDENKHVVELDGVEPNPRLTTVERGADLCKAHEIDFVLAVGGGSVIDCTKAIVVAAKTDVAAWDLITRKVRATKGLPYGSVVTIAGTGAEMSLTSVITNWEKNDKRAFSSSFSRARFAIVDPLLTRTVPKTQTVYGIVDTMSHLMEHYFHSAKNTPIQDQMLESIMRTLIDVTPSLLNDLENELLRETVTYASTIALSDQVSSGLLGDWGTHHIDHALSALFDIPHGAGMGILFPHWMEYVAEHGDITRLVQFARQVMLIDANGLDDKGVALKGIERLRAIWESWGTPTKLRDFQIDEEKLSNVAQLTVSTIPKCGNYFPLNEEAITHILVNAY